MNSPAVNAPILKGRKQSSSTECTKNLNSSKALRSDRSIITCRICLEEGNPKADENAPVIKPCTCSGSLQIVHQICLRQWINTILQKKIKTGDRNLKVYCEICKEQLNYATGKTLVCISSQERKRTVYDHKPLFALCLVMMFLFLAALGGLLFAQTKIPTTNSLYTLIIAGYVMTSIGFCLWLGKFIWTFCFRLKKKVARVLSRTQKVKSKVAAKKILNNQSMQPIARKMNGGVIVIKKNESVFSLPKNNSIDPLNQNIPNPQFA